MSILLLLSIFIFLFPIILPDYYVSELLISFLPYFSVISFVFLIISFVHLRQKMKPGYRFPQHRHIGISKQFLMIQTTLNFFWKFRRLILYYFRGITFLVFGFLFFWYSKKFNDFYVQTPIIQEQTTGDLKVLFANIYKDNVQYIALEKTITDTNPDIIMFVEFASHHYEHLKDFLHTNYPYINHTSRSKKFIGNVVFSKYPINNKADDFPQGMRRYGYVSLTHNDQLLYFYLVHMSSPDTYDHYIMRNKQLHTLVTNFKHHQQERESDNIIIVGDFNLTPWSSDYTTLKTAFSGELTNITTRIPLLFTRRLQKFPLVLAHIDHLWATSSLNIPDFQVITIPGSDHKGFLFTVGTKK